jgi:hypothetical protein
MCIVFSSAARMHKTLQKGRKNNFCSLRPWPYSSCERNIQFLKCMHSCLTDSCTIVLYGWSAINSMYRIILEHFMYRPFLICPNIGLGVLFSDTLNLCPWCRVDDLVSH